MWNYLIGPLVAFLPQRWRARIVPDERVSWPTAALISGLAEFLGSVGTLIWWYFHIMQRYIGLMVDNALAGRPGAAADDHQIQATALILFALHPATWTLLYFWFEGIVRTLAALANGEAPGSLPLVLADRAWTYSQRKREQSRVPLVVDEVTRGDEKRTWDLCVASCRAKPAWRFPLAVRYEGEFYQVIGNAPGGTLARPHVYLLKRSHPGEALRGLENYDPQDALRRDGEPGFFGIVFQELRQKWHARRTPLVADEVRATISRDAAGLEVRSCRPKPEWTRGRLVRYDGGYYRMESSRVDARPRPFVFSLLKLPAGVPGRSVLAYTPDEPLRAAH
jgi:hypothetical protein